MLTIELHVSLEVVPRPSYCLVFDRLQFVIRNWTVGQPGNEASMKGISVV